MLEIPRFRESPLNESNRAGIGGFMHRHRWAIEASLAFGFGYLIIF